jgi:hypothetical protein
MNRKVTALYNVRSRGLCLVTGNLLLVSDNRTTVATNRSEVTSCHL